MFIDSYILGKICLIILIVIQIILSGSPITQLVFLINCVDNGDNVITLFHEQIYTETIVYYIYLIVPTTSEFLPILPTDLL